MDHPDKRNGKPIIRGSSEYTTWNTRDECNFIRQIDQWSNHPLKTRGELLAGYIAAADKRTNWGAIDRYLAVDCAREELMKEGASR